MGATTFTTSSIPGDSASGGKLPAMLSEALLEESRHDKSWCAALRFVSIVSTCSGILLLGALAGAWLQTRMVPWHSALLFAAFGQFTLGFAASELFQERKRRQHRLLSKLQNHSDAVGPALELLHSVQDAALLKEIHSFLHVHLAGYGKRPAAVSMLQISALHGMLRDDFRNREPELAVSAVSALQRVGDESSCPRLRQLAESDGCPPQLREAAETCLVELTERLRKRRLAVSLLRPSADAQHSGTLLRPNLLGEPADQLVRATDR